MDSQKRKMMSVLMLPWLAHGHASPFLELSKRLIERNFFIYFCSTPIILTCMKKKLNEKQSLSIQLVDLHLPSSPDLPPHHHTTNGLPNHLIHKLRDALDMGLSSPSFSLIFETLKPDLVIFDSYLSCAATTMACSHNIPAVQFQACGAAVTCLSMHRRKHPEKEFPYPKIIPQFPNAYKFRGGESPPERLERDRSRVIESMKRSSEIYLIKSFEELEGGYIDYFSLVSGKKVVPVGPLVESPENGDENDEIMEWLNKKDEASTVFVSFGSECFLRKEEIEEIAHGLELSNVNFLWAIRFPGGEKTKMDEVLPKGFLERVGEMGKVWEGWTPQLKILAHLSIGGFMSHCGWSSVMESMKMGVPIIGVPMHNDQPYNAIMVKEVGVGVEVWRDEHGGLKEEEIAKTIRQVLVEKDGEDVRAKAKILTDTMKLKEEEGIARVEEELIKLCMLGN